MSMAKRRGNGEGCIYQRKDKNGKPIPCAYEGKVSIGFDPATGKPKRESFSGKSRREVADKIAEAQHALNTGTYIEPNKITLGEWLDNWMHDYMKPNLRPTAYQVYEVNLRVHVKPHVGHIGLRALQASELQRLFNNLLTDGRATTEWDKKDNPGLSRGTVEKIRTIVKSALKQAVENDLIIKNPATSTKLPVMEKAEVVPFTSEEAGKLLETARSNRMFAGYYLDIFAGLRRGEMLGLMWSDFDWTAPNFEIKRELVAIKDDTTGKYYLDFQLPKTVKSQRTIPMTEDMVKVLKAHKARQAEEKLFFGKSYHNENLVFCSEDGKRIWPRNFNRQYTEILKKAGIEHKKPHTMRHTCASLLLEAGEELKNVQEILGHSKISTTADIYAHVLEKTKRKSLDKLSGIINVDLTAQPTTKLRARTACRKTVGKLG
jgi:integrase